MKNTARFLFSFFLVAPFFLMFACNNAADTQSLQRCDQITTLLDSASEKLLEPNVDTLKIKYLRFSETSKKLEKDFYAIKTDENFQAICQYRECKKPLRNFISESVLFRKDVDSAKVHVERLKHDIKATLLTPEETAQYLALEEENANVILKKITKSVNDALLYERRFDTLNPRINGYIEQARPKK